MTVAITKLANGLTIATENRPAMQSLALGLWVKAGSRSETKTQHGIAHMLEHMAFKGTKTRSALQIARAIEDVGGDINAATSMETTGYFIRVLQENSALAIDILGDIITEPLFDTQELEREKQVILQEIGAANDTPDDVVFDQFTDIAYPNQALGRPILGTPETVKSFSADDLRNFMQEHYFAENMVVAACGALNHEEFVQQIAAKLDCLPAKGAQSGQKNIPVQYHGGDNRQKRDLMDTQVVLGFAGCSNHDADFYAAHMLAMILGGGMSSRLFQEIREKHGLCYSVYAFHWAFADTGLFGIHTATDNAGLPRLIPLLTQELAKAAAHITTEELARARAQYAAGLIMGQENASSRAASIARQLLFFGRVKTNEEILRKLDLITPQHLQKLARRLFFTHKLSLAAIGNVEHMPSYAEFCADLAAQKQKTEK